MIPRDISGLNGYNKVKGMTAGSSFMRSRIPRTRASAAKPPRAGWAEAFRKATRHSPDAAPIEDCIQIAWDEEEWEWRV